MNHLLPRISKAMALCVWLVCMTISMMAQKTMEFSVYFTYNEYLLRPEAIVQLDALVDSLKDAGQYDIKLSGHTDGEGMYDYTQTLSERRAWAVYRYLVRQKLDNGRIAIVGLGERQPASPDTTAKGRARNRRVDVVAQYSPLPELEIAQNTLDPPAGRQDASVSYVYSRVFSGNNGSRIRFRPGAFYPIEDDAVHLEVNDYTDSYQMMRAGLKTIDADGQCLETAGMVFFEAYEGVGGPAIQPTVQDPFLMEIPTENFDSTFQLYQALLNDSTGQRWQPDTTPVQKGERESFMVRLLTAGGFNMDRKLREKPIHEKPAIVKIKGFRSPKVYVAHKSKRSWNALTEEKKNLYRNQEGCDCGGQNPILVAFAEKNNQTYLAEVSFTLLRYNSRKHTYTVKKKFFKQYE